MRPSLSVVLAFAMAFAIAAGVQAQNNVWWNADGTKSLTQDGWSSAGDADFTAGEPDDGTNGVWRITDTNSAQTMRMYKDPGVSSTQGLVMAKIKYISSSTIPKGTFGYSSSAGNHSVIVSVRNGQVNIKSCQEHNTTYNNGDSVTVPGGTGAYRVYALRYYTGGTFDLWVSDGSDWSGNSADWTQLVTGGGWSGQSALLDLSATPRSGLVLGSFGGPATGAVWDGCIDYIAWSKDEGDLQPWDFDPSVTLPDGALLISQNIPTTMEEGQQYNIALTFRNTGDSTWNSTSFKLGAIGGFDPFYPSTRILLNPGETVPPNSEKTFNFTMTAPNFVGTYLTDWKMIHEDVRWFGDPLPKIVTIGTDLTDPGPATEMQATVADGQVTLSWRNPTTPDYTGVILRYKTTTYPTSPGNGFLLGEFTGPPGGVSSFTHTNLVNGKTYYYAAIAYDAFPRFSIRALASAVPYRVGAPGPPQNLLATAGDEHVHLSWTNPTDPDFVGVKVLYKTTGFPTSPTDGTTVYTGAGTSHDHTGLPNGTTFYYSAYAYDDIPEYSSPSDVGVTPSEGACFAERFMYADGNLTGVNGWTGTATADQIEVLNHEIKVDGAADTYTDSRSVSCSPDGGGIVWLQARVKGGVGDTTMWGLWIDDPAGVNLARWYGTATTARGRIGGTGSVTAVQNLTGTWDSITARVDTVANTTEFFFNGSSLGSLNHYQDGNYAGDSVANIKIECVGNTESAGTYMFLDDILVGQADTTAPGPVTAFSVIPGNQRNHMYWTNPASIDYAGTIIRYKTTDYPTSPADGTLCCDSTGTSHRHDGLVNGTTYYYSAFAYDAAANYSTKTDISGEPLYFDPLQAKLLEDDTQVTVTAGVVSASFTNSFYVQASDKLIGIKVDKTAHGLGEGVTVGVKGTAYLDSASGEKYISAVWAEAITTGAVPATGMSGKAIGGAAWNYDDFTKAGQAGIEGGIGPNNIGLLVLVWGKVTQRDTAGSTYFYIDDGSKASDGTQTESVNNVGIRVKADPTDHAADEYVVITGIVSCFKDGDGKVRPQILPRSGGVHELL